MALSTKVLAGAAALVLSFSVHPQSIPNVQAKSYVIMDMDGNVLASKDPDVVRPIASISKLFVAEDIAEDIQPDQEVIVSKDDLATRWTNLKVNTKLAEERLLELALIPSNNQAIYALARAHDITKVIADVNAKAAARGLTTVSLEEPSGLSVHNVASAMDVAKFLIIVRNSSIASVSTTERTQYGNFHSTNPLLGKPGWDFAVSKTGFTNPAGGCTATIVTIGGKQLAIVILGSTNTVTRWFDLVRIRGYLALDEAYWVFNNAKGVIREHYNHRRGRYKGSGAAS